MSRTKHIPVSESLEHAEFEGATATAGGYFGDLVRERMARRAFLKGAAAAGVGTAVAPVLVASNAASAAREPGRRLTFTAIAPSGADEVIVPEEYDHGVVIGWGDPLSDSAPAFDFVNQTADAQRVQFGFNCDFVASFPLPAWVEREVEHHGAPSALSLWWLGFQFKRLQRIESRRTLLWVNHEYTSGSEMFAFYDPESPSVQQVNVELAAHGGSVVVLEHGPDGAWRHQRGSAFNRRITGETRMELTGPLAGHPLLQTNDDPSGRLVRGMFNNCGGGVTPWGTVLSAEENFDQYFANRSALEASDPAKAALHARLPAPSGASERKWERFHPRFDLALEPNEYARFGYVVEIDPYDPSSTPRKHTALGRFKHEAAVPVVAKNRKVVVYSGDDARFEYVYKFVSERSYDAFDRRANLSLLESGTLFVAKFHEDGSGEWLPLVYGHGPLSEANGFHSQAEVLVNTRGAADLLGATRMDRPEDVEVSPVTNNVYIALTNNSARTSVASDPGEVAANPRLSNRWGHVVEIEEDGRDNAALRFRWEIFMLCGDPATTPDTYFAGIDPSQVSPISCPDNLDFDAAGNLWIATDGAPNSPGFGGRNDGIFAVPTEGADRGYVRQFLSGVPGSEVASLKHSGDGKTLFASIQHPGEGGGLPNGVSAWPDGTNLPPRPAVIAVWHRRGEDIGR